MANIIAFYIENTSFKEEGRTVNFIYFYFSKVLSIVPHTDLPDRLTIYELDV